MSDMTNVSAALFGDGTEQEIEALAKKLGGGWRIEQGVMPVVVLTLAEARVLADRLKPAGEGRP